MRDWGSSNDKYLCRQHFLGVHAEQHYLEKMVLGERRTCEGKNLQWFMDKGAVNPASIVERHQELIQGFKERGYNHKSPLRITANPNLPVVNIDAGRNFNHLYANCFRCRERINLTFPKEYSTIGQEEIS